MARTLRVEQTWGRCGRTDEQTLDAQEVMALDERDAACDQADQNVEALINESLSEFHPDVVIAVRNAEGRYTVKGLRNLCDQPDAKRNKGCATRVQTLVDDIFMVNPKKPAAKKPKNTPPEEPNPSGEDTGEEAPPKKGGKKK
jgi:hypothetical protein